MEYDDLPGFTPQEWGWVADLYWLRFITPITRVYGGPLGQI
jgi:hypothetical protein